MSISICLKLHVFILKKIFMLLLWSFLFNPDILSAIFFMITSERNIIFLHILFCYYLTSFSIPWLSRVFYYGSYYLSRNSERIFCCFIRFQYSTSSTINCAFLVNVFYSFSFTSLFTLFSAWNIFPDLSKLVIDAKYMPSKTYIKKFYASLGYVCAPSLTCNAPAGLVLIPPNWSLSITLNCMWIL